MEIHMFRKYLSLFAFVAFPLFSIDIFLVVDVINTISSKSLVILYCYCYVELNMETYFLQVKEITEKSNLLDN